MHLRRASLTAILTAVLFTAGTTASLAASAAPATPAAPTARAAVPWDRVGPGWVLAQYTTARPAGGGSGPETLYLISPDGTKYQLARWPNSRSAPAAARLVARRAARAVPDLLGQGRRRGAQPRHRSGEHVRPAGHGQPDRVHHPGRPEHRRRPLSGSGTSLARYSLSGRLTQSLGYSTDGQVLYPPSGTEFLTGASNGLKLVSNDGAQIRNLPVPGTSANSCNPVRWWNAARCLRPARRRTAAARSSGWSRSAARGRTALTPPRKVSSGDLGDLDAWQLPSGLYLQAAGPCAVLQIFKQARNGSITLVKVPNTEGDDRRADRARLPAADPGPDQLHGQRLAAVVQPRRPTPSSGLSGRQRR